MFLREASSHFKRFDEESWSYISCIILIISSLRQNTCLFICVNRNMLRFVQWIRRILKYTFTVYR